MIVVVGLSHRTAPIDVRERMALPEDTMPETLRGIVGGSVGEVLIVSTCNRVEFVAAGAEGPRSDLYATSQAVEKWIVGRCPGVGGHLYAHVGRDAVRHLFRVAASLDSLVVGEPQILGQLKDAYDRSREVGVAGPVLNRVVPRAIKSAKRVRSETTIGVGQVSVPSVAVDLTRQIFRDLSKHTVALVGSGEMGETVARLLRQAGSRLVVVGRTPERVHALASAMGGEPRTMEQLEATLVDADVVVTTTSAPHFIIDAAMVQKVRKARRGRSLFLIDLAVPRDVDPRVGDIDSVFLYNVDDLSNVVAESLESRRREAQRAEEIVLEEATSYDRWAEAEQVTPTIVQLRERLRRVMETEVERSLGGKLRHLGAPEREALGVMVEAALNKMLHPMTTRLRRMAVEPNARGDLEQMLTAVHELFDLDSSASGRDPSGSAQLAETGETGAREEPSDVGAADRTEASASAREAS